MSAPLARAARSAGSKPAARPMGWPQYTALILAVFGLVDSAYQTYTHLSGTGLPGCSAKTDSCSLVQNSAQAYIFGIPMAVFGVVFYVAMVALCSPQAWRSPSPLLRRARLGAAVVGMVFVLYLLYAELVELGQICPYCTSVHIITFLLFSVIVYQTATSRTLRE